ncbi:sulfate adenylyltransferase [Paenalcaligenes niemegkensis]|uniref:sulfate adenylyltransferase n=1 Tax=Paenalcaligenes niemegkensis TaxID=2895469 RepID=UPI001EE9050A|nr:sulfate adenylyltransferase [Paenalcaligenes niemegkensis]MCQ9616973.1 sulfate adenylyltransferase [Paenalcaligenes niemegkensis]
MEHHTLNFDSYPQQPHGGTLVNQVVPEHLVKDEIERARSLPCIRVDLEAVITIEMIATGVLSPNKGFMNEADYKSVLKDGRLSNGVIWPVPLSFAPIGERNSEIIKELSVGSEVALTDSRNEPVAILSIEDIFSYDKEHRAQQLFGTTDRNHPGVDSIHRRMGDVALGGTLHLLQRVDWGPFEKLRQEPKDTWRLFYEKKKFRSVAGFITGANPLHRGHEHIHRNALEEVDGLFLQPLVEMAKREYVRHEYRMLAYRNVLETYYPDERAILSPLRVTYIFAGPRETVLHALIMKNYGCTHALIGRDHAGIGSFYDKYASHSIFDQFRPEELGIDVRLFHEVFYCTRCASHASTQTCRHDERYRLNISGTGIREMLRHGIMPPKEVVRPESAIAGMQGVQPKGVDENHEGTLPIAKVINSMYPFYTKYTRLGGQPRAKIIEDSELTIRDLEIASQDARSHAGDVYNGVYNEYTSVGDHNRNLQPAWVEEARTTLRFQQERILSDLEEKLSQAPEEASDEFMYQDKAEVERELRAARQLLEDVPPAISAEKLKDRAWNVLPYKRYRGADND